jgi:hypothetical protein
VDFFRRRDAELFVQDMAELLGRAQIEFLSGQFINLFFQCEHAPAQLATLRSQHGGVDQYAAMFHRLQDGRQWHLDIAKHSLQLRLHRQLRCQYVVQAQRDVGIFCGIVRGFLDFNLVEGQLLHPFASNFFKRCGFHTEIMRGHVVHVMARRSGITHVGRQHGVENDTAQHDAMIFQHVRIVLEMLADFADGRIFQQRLQCRQHVIARQLVGRPHVVVAERYIPSLAGLQSKREPDNICLHVIEAGGFGINAKHARLTKHVQQGSKIRFRGNGVVAPLPWHCRHLYHSHLAGSFIQQFIVPGAELQFAGPMQQHIVIGLAGAQVIQRQR